MIEILEKFNVTNYRYDNELEHGKYNILTTNVINKTKVGD